MNNGKELIRKYRSCIKGFENVGSTDLLEEMIDNAIFEAQGKNKEIIFLLLNVIEKIEKIIKNEEIVKELNNMLKEVKEKL